MEIQGTKAGSHMAVQEEGLVWALRVASIQAMHQAAQGHTYQEGEGRHMLCCRRQQVEVGMLGSKAGSNNVLQAADGDRDSTCCLSSDGYLERVLYSQWLVVDCWAVLHRMSICTLQFIGQWLPQNAATVYVMLSYPFVFALWENYIHPLYQCL
jgi:hypothetical protein